MTFLNLKTYKAMEEVAFDINLALSGHGPYVKVFCVCSDMFVC